MLPLLVDTVSARSICTSTGRSYYLVVAFAPYCIVMGGSPISFLLISKLNVRDGKYWVFDIRVVRNFGAGWFNLSFVEFCLPRLRMPECSVSPPAPFAAYYFPYPSNLVPTNHHTQYKLRKSTV